MTEPAARAPARYTPPEGVEARKISPQLDVHTGLPSSWCPGCGHGSVSQILCDLVTELDLAEKTILALGVGCGSTIAAQMEVNTVLSPHGRASDTATGVSRMAPERIVVQYSGDGDACGIGLAGLMHACNRRENFIVVIYNNNAYGMTGGQMGPWKGGGVTFTPESSNQFIEDQIMKYFQMGEATAPEGYPPIRVR